MSKHKHYEMIVAKAANMDLVVLRKTPESDYWEVCRNDWMPTDLQDEFFLCLPQHKDACLHWLNGADVLVKDFKEDVPERVVDSSAFSGWHENTIFMSNEAVIRIKPRKEKRWIVAKPSALVSMMYFESESDAKDAVKYSTGEFKGGQVIEIEVEV